jgi:hypothetical protein
MGYVYILCNPSMPGIVKIGATERSPVDRVAELSAATGVPTPFALFYYILHHDAFAAEQLVHAELEHFRVSEKREFFRLEAERAKTTLNRLRMAEIRAEVVSWSEDLVQSLALHLIDRDPRIRDTIFESVPPIQWLRSLEALSPSQRKEYILAALNQPGFSNELRDQMATLSEILSLVGRLSELQVERLISRVLTQPPVGPRIVAAMQRDSQEKLAFPENRIGSLDKSELLTPEALLALSDDNLVRLLEPVLRERSAVYRAIR